MSRNYTEEQAEISIKLKTLQAELERVSEKVIDSDAFLSTVRKYTRVKKLTPQMLNELIARIDVHQSEKVYGVNIQRLTINYNCVGTIEIPDLPKVPLTEVTLKTRIGVAVSYSNSQNTINF